MTLPSGWTVDEEPKQSKGLPEGWTVEGEDSTPTERDYQRMKRAAGPYAVKELSRDEYEALDTRGKEQYFEELERQGEAALSHQFTTKLLSGLTFGATENVDALKPSEYEEVTPYGIGGGVGELLGSSLPLTGLAKVFSGPAVKLATKSPILQQQLSSLATMFGIGASESGLRSIAKGEVPSAEDMLAHGFEWALLDGALQAAGATGRFVKSLFQKSNATGVPRQELINNVYSQIENSGIDMSQPEKVAQAALEILESPAEKSIAELASQKAERGAIEGVEQVVAEEQVTPKDLREKKITPERTDRLRDEIITLAEPIQPENIDATRQLQRVEEELLDELIESAGERAASEEELGASIKENIETRLKEEKDLYRPLYQEAQAAAETMVAPAERTGKVAGEKLKKISGYAVEPENYPKAIRHLENTLKDMGYIVQRDKATGEIQEILRVKDVALERQIEVGRRLNEIIDFETLEPSVQDVLKDVVKAVKQDIRAGLAANPDALVAFELAEQAHAKTAAKYGKESIRNIRKEQSPEKIAKSIQSPTQFKELKDTLSPQEFSRIEREVLEKMRNQNYERSKKTLRELEKHMTENTKKIAKDIVESKNPVSSKGRDKLLKDAVVDDVSNAINTGSRPDKTLKLWQTDKGRKIVRDAFHGSPNWQEVKSYLEHQSFNDMVSSVTKNGKLDRAKFKEFMRNEAIVKDIRDIGGEEAVSFFRDMDSMVKRVEENAKLLEKLPTKEQVQRAQKVDKEASSKGSKILKRMAAKDFPVQAKVNKWRAWLTETFGLNEKGAMTVFGLMKLGVPNTVANLIGYRIINKMLTSARVRRAFREVSKHQTDPLKFILTIEELGKALDEE